MKRVAIIGIQGVPARYGGFETLVENIIGQYRSDDVSYTVFCSSKDMPGKQTGHKGAMLKYIPLKANGMQAALYDIAAMTRSMGYDVLLVLGVSGCVFLPVVRLLSRAKIIVNIDGLEHRRDKWSSHIRKFLLFSERMAIKFAHTVIADNKGVADYVANRYKKEVQLITYGGDAMQTPVKQERQQEILETSGIKNEDYALSICRIEPENNCHITLDAFSRGENPYKLVFMGNWQNNEYSRRLKARYCNSANIILLDSCYDAEILYTLRKNAHCYIHGHSAGGTNPSLVEAMFFGRPVLAYDCVYNRYTTHGKAYFWSNSKQLQELVTREDLQGDALQQTAREFYTWKKITKEYERLY